MREEQSNIEKKAFLKLIIDIPIQIKATFALLFDMPHEVSGQYGKVEK